MNLDELRSAQAKERRKDSLQHLQDSFYDDVGAYVADLRAARDRRAEQVENPFEDDDIRRLSDEVETAEEVAEALYERRVGKVVKLASFAAADMSVDEEGMTTEERRLFEDLVERITANKSEVLDVLAGESPATDGPTGSDDGPVAGDDPVSVADDDPTGVTDDSRASVTDDSPTPGESERSDPNPPDPDPRAAGADEGSTPDALAGAMGSDEAEQSDPSPGPASDSVGGAAEDVATDDGTDDADDATQVAPEPAPPGAVGVDEGGDAADGGDETDSHGADHPAREADERRDAGATTDDGTVPESTTGDEPDADSETDGTTERTTVRITRDVGAIFGVDEREYDLASEDVVSLPAENADPLVQRDAAERID